ncbi:MAG: alpha/beta hydrolase [Candidatus Hodarchaeales archaeon]|jgi:carboxylesterase
MHTSFSEIKDWGRPFHYEGSTSKALLLIHGFTGSTHQLRSLGKQLAEREGWTTLGIRLPGHGTTVEDLAQTNWQDWYLKSDLALKELDQDYATIAVLGFSFGAALAFYLAAKKNNLVSGVIGLCPALRLRGITQHLVPALKYFKKTVKKGEPSPNDPWRGYHQVPLETLSSVLKFQKITRESLPEVTAPVLVIQGANDKRIPSKIGQEIAQKIASRRFEQFWAKKAGHIIMFSPDAVIITKKISAFLKTL